MKVEFKILDERLVGLGYATAGAAAADLRACNIDGVLTIGSGNIFPYALLPGEKVKIGTGVAVHLGSMTENGEPVVNAEHGLSVASLILPRSGLGSMGIRLSNTVGLIDADYQGELMLAMENRGDEPFVINPLDRLAQFCIVPVFRPEFVFVPEFSVRTERGAGGFGSTGK